MKIKQFQKAKHYTGYRNSKFIVSLIINSGSGEYIKRRVVFAKSAMTRLNKMWKDHSITRSTKIRLINMSVVMIFSYIAEIWTLHIKMNKKSTPFMI